MVLDDVVTKCTICGKDITGDKIYKDKGYICYSCFLKSTRPKKWRDKNFDNFDFTGNEKLKSLITHDKSFMIQGKTGTGKTHLLYAWANSHKIPQNAIWGVLDALNKIKAEMLDNSSDTFERLKSVKFLLLDDLGEAEYSQYEKTVLFRIINYRYENDLPVGITTNLPLGTLEELLGDRTISRLIEMCKIYKINGKDRRKL